MFPVVWTALYGDIAATSAVAIDRLRTTGQHDKARRYVAALGVNLLLMPGGAGSFSGIKDSVPPRSAPRY